MVRSQPYGYMRKFIVNISWSWPGETGYDESEEYLKELIQRLWDEDVVVVMLGGNGARGLTHLDMTFPQNIGTDDNELIIVGGTDWDGTLDPDYAVHRPGHPDSMTVYAQGIQVLTMTNRYEFKRLHGTSFATPQVVR